MLRGKALILRKSFIRSAWLPLKNSAVIALLGKRLRTSATMADQESMEIENST
jgi:hypothetical protein